MMLKSKSEKREDKLKRIKERLNHIDIKKPTISRQQTQTVQHRPKKLHGLAAFQMLEAAKRKKMQTGKTIEDITLNPSETSRYSQTPRQDKEATRINATDLLEPQRNKTANIVPLVTPNSKNE